MRGYETNLSKHAADDDDGQVEDDDDDDDGGDDDDDDDRDYRGDDRIFSYAHHWCNESHAKPRMAARPLPQSRHYTSIAPIGPLPRRIQRHLSNGTATARYKLHQVSQDSSDTPLAMLAWKSHRESSRESSIARS